MDYSFLENIPSSNTPIPSYVPDFSFLQSMQMRANQQYDQGLSQIKNTYSSIFNQPVTGIEANQRQKAYARQAQDQMKDISASDLSNPKNVQLAENIMTPYLNDDELTQNMVNTKNQTSQIQDYYGYLNSSDKDKRVLASPDSLEDMQRGMKQLGDLPLSQGSKFSVRNFTPVYDENTDANEMFVKMYGVKGGVTSAYSDGPTITSVTNGPKSKDAYYAWYLNNFGNNPKYAPQREMQARLNRERSIEQIQANHFRQTGEKLSSDELQSSFANETIDELNKHYTGAIDHINKTADFWDNEISKYEKGHPNGPISIEDVQEYNQLLANKKEWSDISSDYQSQYSKVLGYDPAKKAVDINSPAYKATLREIQEHPDSYLASINKGFAADGWANSMAGISQVDIKANEAYKNVQDHEDRIAALREKTQNDAGKLMEGDRKLTDDENKTYLKYGYLPADIISSRGSGIGKNGIPVDDINKANVYYDTTMPDKLDMSVNKYQNEQTAHLNNISNATFGFDGLASVMSNTVLGNEGLDDGTIAKWGEGMINAREGIKMTPDQIQASGKVKDLMSKYGIEYGDNRPGTVLTNTFDMVKKVAHNLVSSSDPEMQEKGFEMATLLTKVKLENDKYNANEQEYKNNVAALVNSDRTGKYSPLLNPDTHLPYTIESIATHLIPHPVTSYFQDSKVNWTGWDAQGKQKSFSPLEIATAWDKGDITPGSGSSPAGIRVDGKRYDIPSDSVAGLFNNFHNYDNYKSLNADLSDKVVKNMSEYKNGLISASASFDLSGKESGNDPIQRQTGTDIAKNVLIPSNNVGVYTVDNDNKPVQLDSNKDNDRGLKLAIENRKDAEWISKNVAMVDYVQYGPHGQGAVKLTLRPEGEVNPTGKDDKGSKDYDLRALRTIYVDISPHNSSKLLQSLPLEHNTYTYGSVLDGKPIDSDPMIEEFGVRYHITPYGKDNVSGKYTTASVVAENQKIDPITGRVITKKDKDGIDQPEWETSKQSFGIGNPDLLMEGVNKWALSKIADRVSIVKNYSQQPVQEGLPSFEDLKKKSGEVGTVTNNPSNIKYTPEMGKLGAVPSGIKATDGGQFASFPSAVVGFNVYNKLLFGTTDGTFKSTYYTPDTSVDQAMKSWSGYPKSKNWYGGEIYPEVKNKKLGELNKQERNELIKRQLSRESPNMYRQLKSQGIVS